MLALWIAIVVLFLLLVGAMQHIKKIEGQLELLDREQHTQNKDLLVLHKSRSELTGMVVQHRDVLEYLVERDPLLNKVKYPMSSIVGEA